MVEGRDRGLPGPDGAADQRPGPKTLARHGLVLDRVAHVRRPSELSKAMAVRVEQGIDRLIEGIVPKWGSENSGRT